jgi:hypothetical protein
VYDFANDQRVAFVERPTWMSAAIALCPCRLRWEDDNTLMVAWADSVKVVRIKERVGETQGSDKSTSKSKNGDPKQHSGKLGRKFAEVLIWFRTDVFVCGIVPFGPDRIALLGYPMGEDEIDDDSDADNEGASGHSRVHSGSGSGDVPRSRLQRQHSTRELAQEWANDTLLSTDLPPSSTFAQLLGRPSSAVESSNNNDQHQTKANADTAGSVRRNDVNVNSVVMGEGLRVVRGQQAELRILARTDGADVSSETLPLRGFELNQVSLDMHTYIRTYIHTYIRLFVWRNSVVDIVLRSSRRWQAMPASGRL